MFNLNKKGQVSDAVSWIVATIVIVVIMVFFIFGASVLAETKEIGKYKDDLFSKAEKVDEVLFLKKSLFTYFTTEKEEDKEDIMRNLEDRDSKNEFARPLSEVQKEVFSRYDLSR